jgi:hypothetical protein
MRLVFVEWVDSFGCGSGWSFFDGPAPSPVVARSVGWLLHDGKDAKVIVPHVSVPKEGVKPQGCGDMTIPTRAIVRMVDIDEPKAKRRRQKQ